MKLKTLISQLENSQKSLTSRMDQIEDRIQEELDHISKGYLKISTKKEEISKKLDDLVGHLAYFEKTKSSIYRHR